MTFSDPRRRLAACTGRAFSIKPSDSSRIPASRLSWANLCDISSDDLLKFLAGDIKICKFVYDLLERPRNVSLECASRRWRDSLDQILGPPLTCNSPHLLHFLSQHEAHDRIMAKEPLLFLDGPLISPPDSFAISAFGLLMQPVHNQLLLHVMDNGVETKNSHPTIPIFPAIPCGSGREMLVKLNVLVLEKARIEEESVRRYDQCGFPSRG
jgi:hypothetical protein